MALFLSLLILSLSLGLYTKAAPNYRAHDCWNSCACQTTSNGVYKSNVNQLLSTLSSNATALQFHYAKSATVRDPSYGLFLCRGDVGADVCRECVACGAKDIVERCSEGKDAVIWYDQCLLRYSNRSFIGTMDQFPRELLANTEKVTNESEFNELLGVTMKNASAEASAKTGADKKFATRVANFSEFQTLYSLVQCTPDLSNSDCKMCLDIAIGYLPSCCDAKIGGRVLMPSCNIRYEIYPFFNQTPTSPPLQHSKGSKNSSLIIVVAIVGPIVICLGLFILGFFLIRKRKKKNWYNLTQQENDRNDENKYNLTQHQNDGNDEKDKYSLTQHQNDGNVDIITNIDQSRQFDLATIEAATNKFSTDCKLGGGGFGEVYKGTLPDGQEIAVKRLSKSSGQGLGEFKSEVNSLARLQHRNLVRLLGFCFEGEEKLLVYEFVPNKGLDSILFDPEKRGRLDWAKRYKIIGGIARGILYLHEDSRIMIIHRDLKASNILLDAEMNPKISDFGTARIFKIDQTRGTTSNIIGTHGYMSPEYSKHGKFSIKSDVYSFGVLVLEIMSGKKNSSFYQSDGHRDLLSYAWKVWKDNTLKEFLDPTINSYPENEVSRCIQMGLLCVQENPEVRPTMGDIVHMLNRESVTMQVPQQPGVYSIT